MIWQTLNKSSSRDQVLPADVINRIYNYLKKENYPINNPHIIQEQGNNISIEDGYIQGIEKQGAIFVYYSDSRVKEYQKKLCHGYIECLGFRDTKKFNKMVEEIGKSLEDICYVHTGEIK